ncbi:MAG: amino acid permease [Planctomycetaceae bacterium]|nr:amino acid permease [Planctomycetaceae bacterium]
MTTSRSAEVPQLSVLDMSSLLIGIVVGTAIFEAPPVIFSQFSTPGGGLLIWGLGALLAFSGALCYSELATAYTDFGAEYVYLDRAYGRRVAFLFAWMQFSVVVTSSIGAMSFVFVSYSAHIFPGIRQFPALVAAGAILTLLAFQISGLKTGKFVQNLLTASKLFALVGLLLVGFSRVPTEATFTSFESAPSSGSFALALIMVLFAYAGWNDSTAVAPEVRDVQRNLPRALLYGLGFIAVLYISLNLAYLNILGFEGLKQAKAPAANVVQRVLGERASWVMSLVVMISSLGAIHGTMFAGSRLLAAVGRDYPALGVWRKWNARGAPVWALSTLAVISCVLIMIAGTDSGVQLLQQAATQLGHSAPSGAQTAFEILVVAASPVFLFFFTLAGLAVIVLRFTDPTRPRPFRVPGYPFTPLVFCASAGFMFYSSLMYAGLLTLLTVPMLSVGLVLAFVLRPEPAQTSAATEDVRQIH